MDSFLADDGERLHLRIAGAGSPLILLHGWTSSHTIWNPFIEALSQRHRLYIPDARGHGGHPLTLTTPPDIRRLGRDVNNLIEHFELARPAIIGHSMGALTLWQYVGDFGCEQLSGACVIDQSPKLMTDATWPHGIYGDFDADHAQRLDNALHDDFAEAVLRLAARGLNERARQTYERNTRGWRLNRETLRILSPGPLIAIWRSLVAADFRAVVPRLRVPTLLVWGGESNFYGPATAQYVLDKLPDGRLVSYAGADHCPQLTHPEDFTRDLLAFLNELEGARP
jgi:pimeloyl-ACP methyl ester carboxylesterase